MALTIFEAAKKESGDTFRTAVVELFARQSDLLRVLPFENIGGNSIRFNQEGALPGTAFRGVNEGYSEATGVLNPETENLTISGGDLDVDRFIIQTMGEGQRAAHEAMKIKNLSGKWSEKFIKGDSATDPKEFDGLQKRLVSGGNQVVWNHATDGAALDLINLDKAIDAVDNPSHLLMNQGMRRRMTEGMRTTGVSGYLRWDRDEFGRQMAVYNDLPVLMADNNADPYPQLGFDEAGQTTGSTNTSIYVLSLRPGMLVGIQNGGMSVRDLGELDTKPVWRTRIEWYSGIAMFHPRSAARVGGISDAAIT